MGLVSYTALGVSFRGETHSSHSPPTLGLYEVFRYSNIQRRKIKEGESKEGNLNGVLF